MNLFVVDLINSVSFQYRKRYSASLLSTPYVITESTGEHDKKKIETESESSFVHIHTVKKKTPEVSKIKSLKATVISRLTSYQGAIPCLRISRTNIFLSVNDTLYLYQIIY